jgi:Trk K+ transport system NAD-binding subunit
VSVRNLSRRVGLAIAGGAFLLVAYATLYRWGMAAFEGEQLSYVRSLQVVLEALTTAGFGGDAPWSSTEMNALVIAMNLTGVSLVFFAIPFFVVPLLEETLQPTAPTETELTGHVIVCADSPRETALQAELDAVDTPSLYVKRDEDRARALVRDGFDAIQGNPENTGTLERANVSDARAIIADVTDEVNASIILAARRLAPDSRILSVVEDEDTESYHRYAGADEVVRPRVAVGQRLATKVQETQFHRGLAGAEWSDDSLEVTEVLVESGSELTGQSLSECSFRQQYGVTVLGGWFHGEFIAPVEPDRTLVEHTVLLVVGHAEELTTLKRDVTAQDPCKRAVVAGYGVVGKTVSDALTASGVDVTVVDSEAKDGVDVVGDITESATLEDVGLDDADSIVLAVSHDSLAVYSTLVVEDHAPTVGTLARADDVDFVQKCYDAGTEFTLALSEVTAHMVTARLFEDHSGEPTGEQYEVGRMQAPELAGRRLGGSDVRSETGVQIVAVERDGTLRSNPDASVELRQSDTLILAGQKANVAEFERRYAGRGE